jgi:hypothetical protein
MVHDLPSPKKTWQIFMIVEKRIIRSMGKRKGKTTGAIIIMMVCLPSISLVGTDILEDLLAFDPNEDA